MQKNDMLIGATILSIEAHYDEEIEDRNIAREWMSYELMIETDKGILRFAGYHDCPGDIEIIERKNNV